MKKKYIIMITFGVLATLSLIFTIFSDCVWDVIWNIMAMIGSGVLCSAIVSWRVEAANLREQKANISKQREFVTMSTRIWMKQVLALEIQKTSGYLHLHNPQSFTFCSQEMKIGEINKLLLSCIEKAKEKMSLDDEQPIVDAENERKKHGFLCNQIMPYYTVLNNRIADIIENSSFFFINGIFSEEEIKDLASLKNIVESIVNEADWYDRHGLIEYKKIFYEKYKKYAALFGITEEEKIEICYYKELDT